MGQAWEDGLKEFWWQPGDGTFLHLLLRPLHLLLHHHPRLLLPQIGLDPFLCGPARGQGDHFVSLSLHHLVSWSNHNWPCSTGCKNCRKRTFTFFSQVEYFCNNKQRCILAFWLLKTFKSGLHNHTNHLWWSFLKFMQFILCLGYATSLPCYFRYFWYS